LGLARVGTGLVLVCRDKEKGEAAKEEIARTTGNNSIELLIVRRTLFRFMSLFMLSAEKGAQSSLYLAASPEVEGVSGKYFDKKVPKRSSETSYDEAMAKRLWVLSEQMTGLVAAPARP